jgi:hypothetical protein
MGALRSNPKGARAWPTKVKHMREEIEVLAQEGRRLTERGAKLTDQAADAHERVNPLVVAALLAKIGRVIAETDALLSDIERIAHAAQFGIVDEATEE